MNNELKPDKQNIVKHLIVISYDAFSEDNWEAAKDMPNMSKLIKQGAHSTKLRSVYPTLTYTVHTTIVTGVYPDKHKIFHNNPLQPFIPEKEQNWFWFRNAVKAPTIYDAVRDRGMSAAGILWPVTGKASIKYNMPEIAAIKNENQLLKVFKNGSPLYCTGMELRYGKFRKGKEQPHLDNYTTLCAADTIRRKKPNLLLLHLIELDDAKHKYGTDSIEVRNAIMRMDERLGIIMRAVRESGIENSTAILIVGDHGQFDVRYKVHLNNILKDAGLIYEENGVMKWRAYLQSTGGAAYLHIKNDDKDAEAAAVAALDNAIKDGRYGIEKLYSGAELDVLHVNKPIRYMVEAGIGYSFSDEIKEADVIDLVQNGIKYATHGYLPDKPNYKCIFIVSGPAIKQGYSIGNIEMVDIAPTMGKILGIDFNHCDGRVLDEIFI